MILTVYLVAYRLLLPGDRHAARLLAARSELGDRILTIVVDTLQTIPLFVFLIPAVMFLRVGDVSAMLGIVLYAVTPAIKSTNHGLRQVAPAPA